MKKSVILCLILILILFTMSGCWNRRELNQINVVVGLGLDKSEDQIFVTAQVVNPGEISTLTGGKGASPVTVYQAKGDTVFEALRKMSKVSSREIYLAHLRIVVFGETLAKDGVGSVLDFLSRDHQVRTDYNMVVSKGTKAAEILKVLSPLEKIPANKLFSSLETSEKAWAATTSVQLDEFISEIVSEGKHPVLTGIQIIGDEKSGQTKKNTEVSNPVAVLQYTNLAVFKNDKLVDWLNEKESKGYNYVDDRVSSTVVTVACPDSGYVGVELIRTQSEIKGEVKHGRPEMEVKVQTEGSVGDVQCKNLDLTQTQTLYDLETKVEEDIQEKIEAILKKAKQLKVDMLGFGEVIHRSDPNYWKEFKKDWDTEIEDVKVKVIVEAKIKRAGTISNSFLQETKD